MKKDCKIFVTKDVTSNGIIYELTASMDDEFPGMATKYNPNGTIQQHFHRPYWHLDVESAMKHAEEMRERKIKSLKKSLAKVQSLKIRVQAPIKMSDVVNSSYVQALDVSAQ